MTYSTNQFKNGLKIIIDGNPCLIIGNEAVKPGKGQAFNRIKFKNLINQKVLIKTFKSGESLEVADITELDLQYLYNDGSAWYFMDTKSFEQYSVNNDVVNEVKGYLVEQNICTVTLWNNNPISVVPSNHVELKVINTAPGIKGDTVSSTSGKPATMNTGISLQVPLFINIGDKIKVDTRTKKYINRV